ncbi:hypothetical protein AAHC03_01564 [Spirometra sp. Aus1]
MSAGDGCLSFVLPRAPSFGLHPNFRFSNLNKNLLNEFEEQHLPVYLRIRPTVASESGDKVRLKYCLCSLSKVVFRQSERAVILSSTSSASGPKNLAPVFGQSHRFEFSHVFCETSSQEEIFSTVAADRIREFLQGTNSLVFAYGTTSSGKTYTLHGSQDNFGVVPRSLAAIFNSTQVAPNVNCTIRGYDEIAKLSQPESASKNREKSMLLQLSASVVESSKILLLSDKDKPQSPVVDFACKEAVSFHFWISFAELYNETAYDLLDPDVASFISSNANTQRSKLSRKPLDLRMDSKGNVFIKGLRWYSVSSAEEALRLLLVGRKCQQMGATKLNRNSSRSHTIFCIKAMKMANREASRFVRVSSLTFCDLAGSERCNKAQTLNQTLRLREANCINTSLLALGKCIEALRQNQRNVGNPRVVPYRDSKLTRLFQNFLTGRGKACMIVNIAPCRELCDETLHALRFSSIASQICVVSGEVESTELRELCDGAPTTNRIERQLREQLIKQGLKARLTNAAKSRSGEWGDSTLAKDKVSDETEFKRGNACGSNSDPTADQRPSLLMNFLDEKVDLFRLPKSDLIDIVWELSSALLQAQEGIEDVRKEAKASISASMAEELLRIEEQYEALLLEQEKNFERELAQTKARKGLLEEDDQEDAAGGCAACAASAKEMELLKNELEEAKSDLADQQDAIANVSRQRDEFEVAVRKLEYILSLKNEEISSTLFAPATVIRTKASSSGVQSKEVNTDEEYSQSEKIDVRTQSFLRHEAESEAFEELRERCAQLEEELEAKKAEFTRLQLQHCSEMHETQLLKQRLAASKLKQESSSQTSPSSLQFSESDPSIVGPICPTMLKPIQISDPGVDVPPVGPRSLKLRSRKTRKRTSAKPIPAPVVIPELETSDAEEKFLENLTGTATTLGRLPSHVEKEDWMEKEDKENIAANIPKRTRRKAHSSQAADVTGERRITRARSRMISDAPFPSMATIKEV